MRRDDTRRDDRTQPRRSSSAQRGKAPTPPSDAGDPPKSGRRSPDPTRVYGSSQESQARRVAAARGSVALGGAGQPTGTRIARPASLGAAAGVAKAGSGSAGSREGSRVAAGGGTPARPPVFNYLKVYGLTQYARAFVEGGLSDLEAVARLTETEGLEFLEHLRVYPGHRLRLLRAIDCLRHASLGAERRDAGQMLEDDAALHRLCAQREELSKEKHEAEDEVRRLREDNGRLLSVIRQQDSQLQKARDRIAELEESVQAQTEQVSFLAQQLQQIAEESPTREKALYASYKDSFEDDWRAAEKIQLPEVTALPKMLTVGAEGGAGDLLRQRGFSPADFVSSAGAPPPDCGKATGAPLGAAGHPAADGVPAGQPAAAPAPAPAPGSASVGGDITPHRSRDPAAPTFLPPQRAKLAQSLDSAQIKECLAGFDVDHIIKCLAAALQNKVILSVSRARPHTASPECLRDCSIFLEPACKERLLARREPAGLGDSVSSRSLCSPRLSRISTTPGSAIDVNLSTSSAAGVSKGGAPADQLNGIAVRTVPNQWDIYGFLRDVMVNFRLEAEVSVVTLFYMDRFSELSGVAVTPDNWQRLTITAMMLGSKVWNDESFENIEFAQLCPLYTLNEINAFERVFLKAVAYNMSVKGSDYARTYFLLRTLGAKDSADFGLAPLDEPRASRLAERCLEKQMEFRDRYPDDLQTNMMNWTM